MCVCVCDFVLPGTFELTDPTGLPSGYIDVTLKWKFTYLPPSGLAIAPEQARFFTKESPIILATNESENLNEAKVNAFITERTNPVP